MRRQYRAVTVMYRSAYRLAGAHRVSFSLQCGTTRRVNDKGDSCARTSRQA
jgi:hypothetical protein